jgi:hypothetical protein
MKAKSILWLSVALDGQPANSLQILINTPNLHARQPLASYARAVFSEIATRMQ